MRNVRCQFRQQQKENEEEKKEEEEDAGLDEMRLAGKAHFANRINKAYQAYPERE